MPLDRRRKLTLAAGATGLAAVAATTGYLLLRSERKGEALCPAAPLFEPGDFHEGDFVVVQLGALDRSFSEATWARVRGRTLFGLGSGVKVELVGQIGSDGDPPALRSDKHGFDLGERVVVDAACVWDRYRPMPNGAKFVCGAGLMTLPASLELPTAPDPKAKALRVGDLAALVVATSAPVELVWVTVKEQSPGAQVLVGEVTYPTERPDIHGLRQGTRVDFVRDCVVEADISGSEQT